MTSLPQQHTHSLFDQNPDAVVSFDLQGRFVALNGAAESLIGYAIDELIGTAFLSLIAYDNRQATVDAFLKAMRGESTTFRTVLHRKNGEQLHLWLTSLPITVNGVIVGVYGIAKDMSGQANTEERNRLSEERFRNVARATTDLVWDWEFSTGTIWWNEGMHTLFGYCAADLEPGIESWTSRIHPDDLDRVFKGIRAVIDSSATDWTDEYRFRRKDGCYAFVTDRGFVIRDDDGNPVRMVGGISDITARQESQRLLDQLNRALRMLSACNQAMIRAGSEQELLDHICQITRDLGGYNMAWIGYAKNDAARTIATAAHAGVEARILEILRISWSEDTPEGQGPSGMTIRSGQPTVMTDVRNDIRFAAWQPFAEKYGFNTVLCLPLRNADKTFGTLTLYSAEQRAVPAEEMILLCELADNLAFGIENRRIQEERRRLQLTVEKVAATVSSTSSSTNAVFFDELVRNMIAAVGAQAGYIARFTNPALSMAQSVAAVAGPDSQPNFVCSMQCAPCARVISKGECVIDDAPEADFPGASGFQPGPMRGCVGVRLDNSEGQPIGVMFVLFSDPLERVDHTLSTLRIFGARTGAELDRQVVDARLRDQAALLDLATDAIIVRDMHGAVTFWNQGAERLYGWSNAEALDQAMLTRTAAETLDLHESLEDTLRDGEWHGELLQRRKDGGSVAVEARWTLIRDDNGEPKSILAIETDMTRHKSAASKIERLAFYDRLTDLPNQLLLRDRLQHALESNERSGRMGALLCVNLDNFKGFNDALGHEKGDLLLQLVAVRLSYCLRASDTVARTGGDEFVILLVDLGESATEVASLAKLVAEKILGTFGDPFHLGEQEAITTPSIGITLFSTTTNTIDELMRRADLAMYQAKAAGRNTMQFFDPDMQAVVSARVALEAEIRAGLKLGEFLLYYQVQVGIAGIPTGAEALVRWQHPQRGLVPPAAFIPIAEETGLIIALGRHVLEQACCQLAQWASDPALSALTLAVNVSARQFRQKDFVAEVLTALRESGARPDRLKLELTESLLIDDVEETILKMNHLKSMGVGFSLDDFGIGYSSLSYLKRLPLDQLKIDQSFVRDILTDPNDEAIARTIVALGNSLGLTVIAEGVETAEQKSCLTALGCYFFQGYYFSRPVPVEAFIGFVRSPIPAGSVSV
ncbi:bifunctional diguanylate cyclase/phosphodiesterase [Actimicrobium antarcticum]|uniref:Diguanylate cyclase n=1 Tax=Actimicrobium antarcticum TaxID=1051899 RepID=A0ABP7SX71_9BURK